MKVLVVDDSLGLIKAIKNALSKNGYDVELADSYNSGLKIAQARDFDIVISDFEMPDGNGLELIKFLSRNHVRHKPAYILMSAYPEVTRQKDYHNSGVSDFLLKPFNLKDLLDLVKKYAR
jgi:DNA-binding response OmpR family regulator